MSFKDANGTQWDTSVTVGSIRRVKGVTGVDLANIFDEKVYGQLVSDPFMLIDVIVALIKPQLDERDVKEDAFAELCNGSTVELATESLMRSIAEFFPAPKRKPLLHIWERSQESQLKMGELAIQKIDQVMDHQEKEMAEKVEKMDPSTFGS